MERRKQTKGRSPAGWRVLPARRGDAWDGQQVAAHLMACRAQMVCGLRRKQPWAGLDDDTLDSCFGHGAALVVDLASTGKRPDWRSVQDLEKAQVAAFRHQCLDHWKRVNAQSRRGDRTAVAFDPERHAVPDAQLERLFAQPELPAIKRDLLAELDDPALLAFWTLVLNEELTFKRAGDRLGLSKAHVMARTRAGRAAFVAHLDRRGSGELCRERGLDIAADRAGSADARQAERAAAHLESCYACALVHVPRSGAYERGILGVAPVGLLLRLMHRGQEATSAAVTRWSELGAAGRVVTGGVAALAVAGSGASIHARAQPEHRAAPAPAASAARPARPVALEAFRTPAKVLASRAAVADPKGTAKEERRRADPTRRAETPATTANVQPTTAVTTAAGPVAPPPEFSFESGPAPAPPAPTTATSSPPSAAPAPSEFAAP